MRLPPSEIPRREPDLTGLINIVFLILIFFLVAATLRPFSAREIKLAVSPGAHSEAVSPGQLVVFADGRIQYRGVEMELSDLNQRLADDAASNRRAPFTIVADARADAQRVLAVVLEAKVAGFRSVSLLTERKVRP